jgi:hypothetical protein
MKQNNQFTHCCDLISSCCCSLPHFLVPYPVPVPVWETMVIECSHFGMVMRGISKVGSSSTVIISVRGCFQSDVKTRSETIFFSIIRTQKIVNLFLQN